MSISFKVRGVDRLARLAAQKGAKAQVATDRELELSSLRIEGGAKDRAAVDTGDMKKNIFQSKAGKLTYKITSPQHYSIYVEKGTRKMKAQPFLQPAIDEERPTLLGNLKRLYGK